MGVCIYKILCVSIIWLLSFLLISLVFLTLGIRLPLSDVVPKRGGKAIDWQRGAICLPVAQFVFVEGFTVH